MPRSTTDDDSTSSDSSDEDRRRSPAAVRAPSAADAESPDPDSPGTAQQSSDESTSSDVVLVDLPAQESRLLQGDSDGGILVNIDGSMQDNSDAGREETFVDAPDQLGSTRSASLGESLAVIEFGEESSAGRFPANELDRVHERLDETVAECRKYKEEREVFGREIAGLRRQLQSTINQQSFSSNDGLLERLRRMEQGASEEDVLSSPTPLHSMIGDCSKLVSHLKGFLDEQLNSEATIRELHAILYTKDQEIEDLNAKVTESDVSRGVVVSYLGSLQEVWSESLVEKMNKLEEENAEMSEQLGLMRRSLEAANAETSRTRTELEQTESRLVATREKLSMAVNKGKSLVQHRDTLKHSLAERTTELESCRQELQQKSEALRSTKATAEGLESELEKRLLELQEKSDIVASVEASTEELQRSLAEKNGELERCLLQLNQKTDALEITEGSAEELQKSLAEKTNELERCLLELQEKSDAVTSVEASAEELQRSLAEKNGELERCLHELDQKTDALGVTNISAAELKNSLAEKTSELERCLLELQQISKDFENAKTDADRLSEAQNLVQSLQGSLSHRDKILQEIEETLSQYTSTPELLSMDVIDRVKWFINQKHVSDDIFEDNRKIRDALSVIDLPEDISSVDIESQIHWLGKSLAQSKTDFIKLQDEIANACGGVTLHETELTEAHKEIDRLAASLLEERQMKDSARDELDGLRRKYEEMAEKLISISSQKDRLMEVLAEVSESTFDEQPSADTGMIEQCIDKIKERIRTHGTETEHFDRIQSLLYVKDQELMLLESILEEVTIDRSDMENISTKLDSASEELVALRNERDSLQRELERVEERSSQIRDRLSLAVRKGKGLVQERDGYKHSLDEKNTQIEMLNQELQLRDSTIAEYRDNISSYSENIQKLELDVVSLKDQRGEFERLLQQRNNTLQNLLDSVESVVLPTNKHFEGPVEKVNWIAECIHKSEVAKTQVEEELEAIKEEVTLQTSRLTDAFTTIKLLEDQLSKADKKIAVIAEEKKDMQARMTFVEQESEKMKEEHYMQATKLADAYTIIKSLEDALSNANTHISFLNSEITEAESRSKLEINTLNTKLAEYKEELAKTHGSLESKSDELINHIGHLQVLMKDESMLSLMTEAFRKKVDGLRNMGLLVQNMQEELAARGLRIPGSEYPEFTKLFSLLQSGDFIKDRIVRPEMVIGDPDDLPSFAKLAEGFRAQATLLGDTFKDLSSYLDGKIAVTVQALQATRDQFIQILEVNESLTVNLNNLEAQNTAQESKIISLKKEITTLLSACTDATEELELEAHDLLDLDCSSEPDKISLSLESTSKEAVVGVVEQWDAGESPNPAKSLLLAARRIRNHFEQLANVRRVWLTSTDNLKERLKQAELSAATAISDGHLNQERVSKLQGDIEALQNVCSEMEVKIEGYQAQVDTVRDKEAELLSLEQTLTAKHRGLGDKLFSQDQMETLIDKINRMEIPSYVSETQSQKVLFSSPFDKLFHILDKVAELQHRIDSLSYEKDDMQLSLESYVREIEHLKKSTETTGTDYRDLELKKIELIDLTVGLERIIQRLGGNYSFEDQKLITTKGLLPVLERLTSASSLEAEKLKSRIQDFALKLQEKEKVADELSAKVKFLEDSIHARIAQPDTVKERTVFESSTSATGSEISEIEDVGALIKSSMSPVSAAAAHVRTMRKGSADQLVLNIDSESDRLISAREIDDKGHFFKSLNASGLIPKQGRLIADRVDGIWVSGGRILMSRPGARLSLISYWLFLHIWLLGTIL